MPSKGLNSAGGLFHDFLKWCVAKWGEANGWDWEFEGRVDQERTINPFRSDVALSRKKYKNGYYNKVYVEVQNDIKPKWKAQMKKQYENLHYLIINLNKFKDYQDVYHASIEDIYADVCLQLENEVDLEIAGPNYDNNNYYIHCEDCGARIKKTNETKHLKYQCKKRKQEGE